MSEFFQMGGYAVYVWSAYGVVAIVLAGLAAWTLLALKGAASDLRDLEAMAPRRRRRAETTETQPRPQETRHAQS